MYTKIGGGAVHVGAGLPSDINNHLRLISGLSQHLGCKSSESECASGSVNATTDIMGLPRTPLARSLAPDSGKAYLRRGNNGGGCFEDV